MTRFILKHYQCQDVLRACWSLGSSLCYWSQNSEENHDDLIIIVSLCLFLLCGTHHRTLRKIIIVNTIHRVHIFNTNLLWLKMAPSKCKVYYLSECQWSLENFFLVFVFDLSAWQWVLQNIFFFYFLPEWHAHHIPRQPWKSIQNCFHFFLQCDGTNFASFYEMKWASSYANSQISK